MESRILDCSRGRGGGGSGEMDSQGWDAVRSHFLLSPS